MIDGWREVLLGDIAEIDLQNLGSKTKPDFEFEYISLSNVEPGRIVGPLEKCKFADAPSRARRIVGEGDILISTVRPNLLGFARVGSDHRKCIASTGFAVVKLNKSFEESYIFHLLFTHQLRAQFHALVVGSNYPAINSNDVKKLRIVAPPLFEQRKIAKILSTWDQAIEVVEELISNSQAQKKALMQQLFFGEERVFGESWSEVSIGELGEISGAGVDKKTKADEKSVRLLNYLDVLNKDYIFDKDLDHWVTAPDRQIASCDIQKGDIFFTPSSETRSDIAHSAVATENICGSVYSYHVVRLRLHELWDLNFSAYAFKSPHFFRQAYQLCEGSGQRYVLSQRYFRQMTVHVPSIQTQRTIGIILRTMDEEIAKFKAIATVLHQEKKALMQQLLTGNRRVKMESTK